jgi:hypothetical protein
LNDLSAPDLSSASTCGALMNSISDGLDGKNVKRWWLRPTAQTRCDPLDSDCQRPQRSEVFALTEGLLQLRQHLLAVLLDLRIVFFRILHRKAFFDKATAFIFSAHLYVNRTESDVMH